MRWTPPARPPVRRPYKASPAQQQQQQQQEKGRRETTSRSPEHSGKGLAELQPDLSLVSPLLARLLRPRRSTIAAGRRSRTARGVMRGYGASRYVRSLAISIACWGSAIRFLAFRRRVGWSSLTAAVRLFLLLFGPRPRARMQGIRRRTTSSRSTPPPRTPPCRSHCRCSTSPSCRRRRRRRRLIKVRAGACLPAIHHLSLPPPMLSVCSV